MKFETLKSFDKKKVIIPIVIISCLIIVITIFVSQAKYISKDSITIIDDEVNYKPYPYKVLKTYKQKNNCDDASDNNCYEETSSNPGMGYELNEEKTWCYVDDENIHTVEKVGKDATGQPSYSELPMRSKCTLYFSRETKGINIIAKANGSEINFPSQTDNYTPTSIACDNGVTAKFDYTNWEVEVDALENTNVTCTVNFEEFTPQAFNTYLTTKKLCNGTPKTDGEAKDCLIDENETGNGNKNYRYEGSNPNNYVLFNDELWRIIGVFNVETTGGSEQDLVKLIRAQALDALAWNNGYDSAWDKASLKQSLNNGYLNAEDEECYVFSTTVTKTCYFSETGIKDGAREKIEAVRWNVGQSGWTDTAKESYTNEINTITSNYYKVGLMSASDYGYAVLAENFPRTNGLNVYYECTGQNWLKNISMELTLTPSLSNCVIGIGDIGSGSTERVIDGGGFRPSIYLKSNEQVIRGAGTHDDPYILK